MVMKTPSELVVMIEEYETIKDSFKRDFSQKFENPESRRLLDGPQNNFQNMGASGSDARIDNTHNTQTNDNALKELW
ncbi:hypothetical protein NPIL_551071 [Nephila pilipes]|uniref:Uncharacterized protein n=1 Tax=Nephila pilipes TaxID=299642 RepID=A0A8X6MXC1_NEPPI|nr:hypothetical protein NPIL_551071 [Nephila pilipes]